MEDRIGYDRAINTRNPGSKPIDEWDWFFAKQQVSHQIPEKQLVGVGLKGFVSRN